MERHSALLERVDLGRDSIDTDDSVAELREDRARHQPHVPGPNHADVHDRIRSLTSSAARAQSPMARPRS